MKASMAKAARTFDALRIKMEAVSEPIAKTAEAPVPAVAATEIVSEVVNEPVAQAAPEVVTEAVSEPATQNAEAVVPAPAVTEEVVPEGTEN
jgi:large subunit ribosomal protein L10